MVDDDDTLTIRGDQDTPERSLKGSFADSRSVASNEEGSKSVTSPAKKSMTNGHSGIIVSNFDVMSKIQEEFNKQKEGMAKKDKQREKEREKEITKTEKKGKGKGGKDDCSIF